jgi:predicted transcriptional regulator
MNQAIGTTDIEKSLEVEIRRNIRGMKRTGAAVANPVNAKDEVSATNLGTLLRRVTEASTHEVEILIDELHGLRKKLESDSDRIQNDIARHAELSQGAMQLVAIISDSVKKIPGAPSISP